jgi:hypothetical protein
VPGGEPAIGTGPDVFAVPPDVEASTAPIRHHLVLVQADAAQPARDDGGAPGQRRARRGDVGRQVAHVGHRGCLRRIAGTGSGGWADSRRTRKFPSSRAAVCYTWGARSAPSPRSPGRGSHGLPPWKRLAPEISKIEISEGLVVEDARPAALRKGHPRQPQFEHTITLRLARAQLTEPPRTGMAPPRRRGLFAPPALISPAPPWKAAPTSPSLPPRQRATSRARPAGHARTGRRHRHPGPRRRRRGSLLTGGPAPPAPGPLALRIAWGLPRSHWRRWGSGVAGSQMAAGPGRQRRSLLCGADRSARRQVSFCQLALFTGGEGRSRPCRSVLGR